MEGRLHRILVLPLMPLLLSGSGQERGPSFVGGPAFRFNQGKGPADLALADLDQDGLIDLVFGPLGVRRVYVARGKGGGRFETDRPPIPLPIEANQIAIGDLNNDGKADLALAQHDLGREVVVLAGDGKGGFAPIPGSPFTPRAVDASHYHGLILADMDGDGSRDIVLSDASMNAGKPAFRVAVMLNDGKGGFGRVTGTPTEDRLPSSMAVADVDLDGKPDVVLANEARPDVTVLLGDGTGALRPAPGSPVPVAGYVMSLATGDVNGDLKPDLVMTHDRSGLISVSLGDGTGGFSVRPGPPLDMEQPAWQATLHEMNGDGSVDLVVRTPTDGVTLLWGDGRGDFTKAVGSPFLVGAWFRYALGDTNGDGKTDVVVSKEDREIRVLLAK